MGGWTLTWGKFWSMVVAFVLAMILVGPALQPLRHPPNSRRMQCASCLRQIGLGIQGYVNAHDVYPPGTIANPDLPLDRRLGWGVAILPFIDNVDLFNALRGDQACFRAAADDPIFAREENQIGITHCPDQVDRSVASYTAIAGLGADAPSLPAHHPRAGAFGDDRRVTPTQIEDGMATTMLVAESAANPGPWQAGGRATVRGLDPAQRPYIGPGRQFGGLHAGGANVLMADGSVKVFANAVNPRVFEAMSTIAGGERLTRAEVGDE